MMKCVCTLCASCDFPRNSLLEIYMPKPPPSFLSAPLPFFSECDVKGNLLSKANSVKAATTNEFKIANDVPEEDERIFFKKRVC